MSAPGGGVSASKGGCLLPGVPGGDTPLTDTAAGGTHPTGMHSCVTMSKQECIPVGCILSAAVAVSRGGEVPGPGGVPGPRGT